MAYYLEPIRITQQRRPLARRRRNAGRGSPASYFSDRFLVKARAKSDQLAELKARLDRGEILTMRPFGQTLNFSLQQARLEPDGWAVWEEEDYCQPPLAMERAAVLDAYFTDLRVEQVEQGAGWQQIGALPSMWAKG